MRVCRLTVVFEIDTVVISLLECCEDLWLLGVLVLLGAIVKRVAGDWHDLLQTAIEKVTIEHIGHLLGYHRSLLAHIQL